MRNSLIVILIVVGILAGSVGGYALAPRMIIPPPFEVNQTSTVLVTRYTTLLTNTSSTASCTNTGGIGCPHFFNQTWLISVNYNGAWGLSYQGYLASGNSLVESHNYFGHGSTNVSISLSGIDTFGIKACVQAQKLDSTTNLLAVSFVTPSITNQTSVPYGTASICLQDVIV